MISRVATVTLVLQHRRVEPNTSLELLVYLGAEGDPGDHPGVGEDKRRDSRAADADIRSEIPGLMWRDEAWSGSKHRLLLDE